MDTNDRQTLIARIILIGIVIISEALCGFIGWLSFNYVMALPKDMFSVIPSPYGWFSVFLALGAMTILAASALIFVGLLKRTIIYFSSK